MANTNLQYLKQFKNFLIAELRYYSVLLKQFKDKFIKAMAKFFTVLLHYGLYTAVTLILIGLFVYLTITLRYGFGFAVWVATAIVLYFIIDMVNDIYTYNVSGLIAVLLLIIYLCATIYTSFLSIKGHAYVFAGIEILLSAVILVASFQVRKKHFGQPPAPPNLPPGYPPCPPNPPPGNP